MKNFSCQRKKPVLQYHTDSNFLYSIIRENSSLCCLSSSLNFFRGGYFAMKNVNIKEEIKRIDNTFYSC